MPFENASWSVCLGINTSGGETALCKENTSFLNDSHSPLRTSHAHAHIATNAIKSPAKLEGIIERIWLQYERWSIDFPQACPVLDIEQ